MTTFVTHPSVRIKGTENNYSPMTCTDVSCMHRQNIHWHCPFCSRHESFNDVVILKAHYRVKHVDKGIDFAGLKVLRCCDTCDIVGAIKGEKKFKGAHWHCYRCRNGFNRRDEAIKHYRTHFRNPQTTFQIQIAQEIETQLSATNLECEEGLHNAIPGAGNADIASTPYNVDPANEPQHKPMPDMQVSVAANETVNSTPQAIMLIQGGNLNGNASQYPPSEGQYEGGDYADPTGKQPDILTDQRYADLQLKYREALEDKTRLTLTVEELKLEMQVHMQEVARYQKREEELLNQLSIPLDKGIQDLLKQLETQHRELLYHQLAHVKRTYPQMVDGLHGANMPNKPDDHDDVSNTSSVNSCENISENVLNSVVGCCGDKGPVLGQENFSRENGDDSDEHDDDVTISDNAANISVNELNDATKICDTTDKINEALAGIDDPARQIDVRASNHIQFTVVPSDVRHVTQVVSYNGEEHNIEDEEEEEESDSQESEDRVHMTRASKRRKVS